MGADTLPDGVMIAASKALIGLANTPPMSGSKWLDIEGGFKMRVDTFGASMKATIFPVDEFGVAQVYDGYVLTRAATPEIKAERINPSDRFAGLLALGEVSLKSLAWKYMRSGDTLIGMSLEDVAEFVLSWELQAQPERFTE